MTSVRSVSRRMLTVLLGCAVTALPGCRPHLPPDGPTLSLLTEADSLYDYGPDRTPISVNDPDFRGPRVPDGTIPRMWIATATLKPNVSAPKTRIIARIRSEGAYPQMGIAAGDNYIWRNSRDSSLARFWVTRIISNDSTMAHHELKRDPRLREYTHGDPKEPRLVILTVHSMALGGCLDDPMCLPSGHCGYY